MENLTHTLFGLALAKAGLENATPLATTTLVISSNLPDIDFLMGLDDTVSSLKYHRGITHSFVGVTILAAAITIVLGLVDRRFRLRRFFGVTQTKKKTSRGRATWKKQRGRQKPPTNWQRYQYSAGAATLFYTS